MRNSCNHEEFPGVKVSFQALDSKIKENDEEDKKLHNKNENLKSEIQQSDNIKKKGRREKRGCIIAGKSEKIICFYYC